MVVAEGRKLAQSLSGARKANMQQLCDEVEQLTYQLGDMCRRGQVSHWRHLQVTLEPPSTPRFMISSVFLLLFIPLTVFVILLLRLLGRNTGIF